MEYPITVNSITVATDDPIRASLLGNKAGEFVAIRPVGDEHGGKTYLGIYIGDVAISVSASLGKDTGVLTISRAFYNPGILVPSLGRVVYGMESWWGKIEAPEDMRQITDQDIDSVWYVQALKSLEAKEKADV